MRLRPSLIAGSGRDRVARLQDHGAVVRGRTAEAASGRSGGRRLLQLDPPVAVSQPIYNGNILALIPHHPVFAEFGCLDDVHPSKRMTVSEHPQSNSAAHMPASSTSTDPLAEVTALV